ncbi:MAG: purine-cytosine permease family protein [Actinomycetes bacterium]
MNSTDQAFSGARPSREGDLTLEMHGMAPIPETDRYGGLLRVFTVWFTPNLVPAGFFIGTLATASFVGVGFGLGLVAILVGTVIGSLPAAYLGTWGPRTGLGQLPLGRLVFGRSTLLPGGLMWLSTIAWDAINALFGAEALALLIHVPFWIGLAVILVLQGLLGLMGYEMVHTFQKWMSIVLALMFLLLTIRISSVGTASIPATAHGAGLAGGFVLMVTLSASFVIAWATYAADYTRYMKPTTSRAGVFWLTLAGLTVSSVWVEVLGLAASKIASDQTAAGMRTLAGGGVLGVLVLIAVAIGTVSVNAMNDYSGSLSLQAAGARILRPAVAVIVTVVAFGLTLWLNTGDLAAKFTNILLFITYWVPCYVAVVVVDWYRRGGRVNPSAILDSATLPSGWTALVALVVGFLVSIPFMDTSLYVGPAAKALQGADIAYSVGFLVAGGVYAAIGARVPHGVAAVPVTVPVPPPAGSGGASELSQA